MTALFAVFVVITLVSYVVLDGFDLGVGLLFPFAGNEEKRTLMMASIAPIWDGNETFLVLGAMVLLTGFPRRGGGNPAGAVRAARHHAGGIGFCAGWRLNSAPMPAACGRGPMT